MAAALAEFVKPVVDVWAKRETRDLYSDLLEQVWLGAAIDEAETVERLRRAPEVQEDDSLRRDFVVGMTLGVLAEALRIAAKTTIAAKKDSRPPAQRTLFATDAVVGMLAAVTPPSEIAFRKFAEDAANSLLDAADDERGPSEAKLRAMAHAASSAILEALPLVAARKSWPPTGELRAEPRFQTLDAGPPDGEYEDF
jgi:hypothetical protein